MHIFRDQFSDKAITTCHSPRLDLGTLFPWPSRVTASLLLVLISFLLLPVSVCSCISHLPFIFEVCSPPSGLSQSLLGSPTAAQHTQCRVGLSKAQGHSCPLFLTRHLQGFLIAYESTQPLLTGAQGHSPPASFPFSPLLPLLSSSHFLRTRNHGETSEHFLLRILSLPLLPQPGL